MSTTPASNGSSGRASVPNALPPSAGARARVTGASTPTSPSTPGVYGKAAVPGAGGGGGGVVPPRRPGGNEYPGRRKIRPRWGRIALVAGAAIVVLALLAGVGAYSYYR